MKEGRLLGETVAISNTVYCCVTVYKRGRKLIAGVSYGATQGRRAYALDGQFSSPEASMSAAFDDAAEKLAHVARRDGDKMALAFLWRKVDTVIVVVVEPTAGRKSRSRFAHDDTWP